MIAMQSTSKAFYNQIEEEIKDQPLNEYKSTVLDNLNLTIEQILSEKERRKRPSENPAIEDSSPKIAKFSTINNDRICYSLLCLFLEYSRKDDDVDCSTDAARKLVDWLLEEKINVCDPEWFDKNELKICKYIDHQVAYAQLTHKLRKILHILLDCNGDINYTDRNGQTLLHAFLASHAKENAILSEEFKWKDCLIVETLLDRGASIDTVDKEGNTPLHIALESKRRDLMKIMLPHFNNVDSSDKYGNTILHLLVYHRANQKDFIGEIRSLLATKRPNVNKRNVMGMSVVHMAAENCDMPLLRIFKRNQAKLNVVTRDNETPLLLFCRNCKDVSKQSKAISLLMTGKCDVNVKDKEGYTPLHYVADRWLNIEAVQRLIDLGAELNSQTYDRALTPLHCALKSEYQDTRLDKVKALVLHGALVNLDDDDGLTPLHLAMAYGSVECMKFLIDHDADVHCREENFGLQPLHLMAFRGEIEKMKLLLDRKANHRAIGYNSLTPLHLASMVGNFDLVKILIEYGASVNYATYNSRLTPLHLATMKKLISKFFTLDTINENDGKEFWKTMISNVTERPQSVIEFLVANGADLNARDVSGKTPMHYANLEPESDAFEIFLKSGASANVEDEEGFLPLHYVIDASNVKAVKCLLKHSVENLNDNDISNYIIIRPAVQDIVLESCIIKLEAADLEISDIYKRYVDDWKIKHSSEYEDILEEVKKMKKYLVDVRVSLYNILHLNAKERLNFVKCVPASIESEFPIYCDIIRATCRDVVEKQLLVKQLKLAWYRITNIDLPDICIECILFYLSNRNLTALIEAVKFREYS